VLSVRARRPKPGLAAQHLTAVSAVAAVCDARTEGLHLGSREFVFEPRSVRGGHYEFDIGTAGSIPLVLQALLPVMIASGEAFSVRVTGGTDVRAAPPLDYLRNVLLPLIGRMGARVRVTPRRRGYYPKGGGIVEVDVEPAKLAAIDLSSPGRLLGIECKAHVANLPEEVATRMGRAAVAALPKAVLHTSVLSGDEAIGIGGSVLARASYEHSVLGGGRVAERGVRAETLGAEAGHELAADMAAGVALDEHAGDQILVYLALAGGESSFTVRELSSHATTAMWLLEKFLPVRFTATQDNARATVSLTRA
jgi:RNA 3'-phosphate cyclase